MELSVHLLPNSLACEQKLPKFPSLGNVLHAPQKRVFGSQKAVKIG